MRDLVKEGFTGVARPPDPSPANRERAKHQAQRRCAGEGRLFCHPELPAERASELRPKSSAQRERRRKHAAIAESPTSDLLVVILSHQWSAAERASELRPKSSAQRERSRRISDSFTSAGEALASWREGSRYRFLRPRSTPPRSVNFLHRPCRHSELSPKYPAQLLDYHFADQEFVLLQHQPHHVSAKASRAERARRHVGVEETPSRHLVENILVGQIAAPGRERLYALPQLLEAEPRQAQPQRLPHNFTATTSRTPAHPFEQTRVVLI